MLVLFGFCDFFCFDVVVFYLVLYVLFVEGDVYLFCVFVGCFDCIDCGDDVFDECVYVDGFC